MKNKHFLALGVATSLLLLTACSDDNEIESPVIVSNPAGTPVGQPTENNAPPQIKFDTQDNSSNGFSVKEKMPDGLNEVKQQLGMEGGSTNTDPNVVVIGGEEPNSTGSTEENYQPSSSLNAESLKNDTSVDEKLAAIMAAKGEQDASLLTGAEEKVIEYAPSTYNYRVVQMAQLTKDLKEWHDENKDKAGVYQKEQDGDFFIMIAAGSQSHSGYQLNVRGVYDEKDEVRILFTLDETKGINMAIETKPTVILQMKKPTKKVNLYNMSE